MVAPWSPQPGPLSGPPGRSLRTAGRGRRPPGLRAPSGAVTAAGPRRFGEPAARLSRVEGFLPLLSDLSGQPRCEGASGLSPPSCGEPTCPAPPLISAPAAGRRPRGPSSRPFRGLGAGGAGPCFEVRSGGLWFAPRPPGARGAASCSSLRTSARARPAAAGGSASETLGRSGGSWDAAGVQPTLRPGPPPRFAPAPGAGPQPRVQVPQGAPPPAEETRPRASARGPRADLTLSGGGGPRLPDGLGGGTGLKGGELPLGRPLGQGAGVGRKSQPPISDLISYKKWTCFRSFQCFFVLRFPQRRINAFP